MLGLCPHLVPAEELGASVGSCPEGRGRQGAAAAPLDGALGVGEVLLSLSLATGSLWSTHFGFHMMAHQFVSRDDIPGSYLNPQR